MQECEAFLKFCYVTVKYAKRYCYRLFVITVKQRRPTVLEYVYINPRPTGGGGYFEPPLSFSCDIF